MPLSLRRTLTEWFDGKAPKNGASEGIRTLDVHLGKVMLYQLSYARVLEERVQVTKRWLDCKCCFSRQARLPVGCD